MITRPTVIVLGAGASVPYGFYSGLELLTEARRYPAEQFAGFIPLGYRDAAPALHAALKGTLARSIDAMLEKRLELVDAGKSFMARWLLQCERNMLDGHPDQAARRAQQWLEMLWDACDQRSLKDFRATPLKLITYNYDRSIEFVLARALRETFSASVGECAEALDRIGPIHLHGQLGMMPSFAGPKDAVLPFGLGAHALTDDDVVSAAKCIRIVHEPKPIEEPFVRAREAISKAERVIFIGFGYARQNVERLLLTDCMQKSANVFLCTLRFTRAEVAAYVLPHFSPWNGSGLHIGDEHHDIVNFFRAFPEALL